MILDNEKKWLISLPPKSGTYSFEKSLKKYGVRYGQMHGHEKMIGVRRVLIVRDPIDRFCSMYWFCKQHIHRKTFFVAVYKSATDINTFVRAWLDKRKVSGNKNLWTRSMTYYIETFKPTHVVKLDALGNISSILKEPNLVISHIHKSTGKKNWKETSKGLRPDLKKELLKELKEDLTKYKSL